MRGSINHVVLDPQELMKQWPLTNATIGDELVAYPTRRVVTVSSDEGAFVAKVDPDRAPDAATEAQLGVLDHLAWSGFRHAPALLHTRHGKRVAATSGGTTWLLEFIPEALDPHQATAATWRELGLAAARLNAHTSYTRPFVISVDRAVRELGERVVGHPFERQYLELLERVATLRWAERRSIVHGELNESNARRRTDGTLVLVDWDQAGRAPVALEYGYPLITVFISAQNLTFDEDLTTAFYRGYADGGGVIDVRQVFDAALFHALRYMWFEDVDLRWERILHAVAREADIMTVVSGAGA